MMAPRSGHLGASRPARVPAGHSSRTAEVLFLRTRRSAARSEDLILEPKTSHRVVIIGSGFGGLFAARRLRHAPVDLTLIDRTNHHLFQPLLYQVATGILSEGEIAPAVRDVLRHHRRASVELSTVTGIDIDRRLVTSVQAGRQLQHFYDTLIVATGIETSYFGHREFSQWAPGMKTIDDALELRGRIFGAFELAESQSDPVIRQEWLTFVVIGGGPTGVEMAGQIAELSRRSLKRNFRNFDASEARILLYEGGPRILAEFGDRLSSITRRSLSKLGVNIFTDTMVVDIDEASVHVRLQDGTIQRVPARTKVWAAGMHASSLGAMLATPAGAQFDHLGRVKVRPDCTLPGHPEIFIVGDLMVLEGVPGMAEGAMQSGMHAAETIKRRLKGDHTERPFHYRDLGMLATISRFRAVAKIGAFQIGGFVGWLLWLVVHLTFLTGFKNRIAALAHWAISFLGRGRSERTITRQQVLARRALERSEHSQLAADPSSSRRRTSLEEL